jgi:hypothetical protein
MPLAQRRQPVGQLDLAALARLGLREDREDLRRQHVAADDRQPRRRRSGRRLLDQLADLQLARRHALAVDDAVHVLLPRRHSFSAMTPVPVFS